MIIWAHGLEGSPMGTKVQALRAAGLPVTAPDGRGLALADRLPDIEAALHAHADQRVVLAGSSYGGLAVACLLRRRWPQVAGVLLCAPALHHREPPLTAGEVLRPPVGLPVRILHGRPDAVVPLSASEGYVAAAPTGADVRLDVVEDDHRLSASVDTIVGLARELGAAAPNPTSR